MEINLNGLKYDVLMLKQKLRKDDENIDARSCITKLFLKVSQSVTLVTNDQYLSSFEKVIDQVFEEAAE